MKYPLIIILYLFTFLSFVNPQSRNELIKDPFVRIHQKDKTLQIVSQHPENKEFQKTQNNHLHKKKNKNNKFSSVLYRPVKVTLDENLKYLRQTFI